jgi:hypothetical protein
MPAWGSDTALPRYEVPAETRGATVVILEFLSSGHHISKIIRGRNSR